MLDDTPVPSRTAVITDCTPERELGRNLSTLMGHVLNGVIPQVFGRAHEARIWASNNKHNPPFLFNVMWPIQDHFDTPAALEEEIRQVGWLIWGLEGLVLKGICHIIVIGIPGREEIKASLMKLQFPAEEETKRFNLHVEALLEPHRPLGEPRQPPITDYIEMGSMGDGVDRLCLLWSNCLEAADRRVKA